MCYNEQVSISVFVVGTIFNLLLLFTFIHIPIVVALAIFLQFVVMVQLVEGFAWLGYHETTSSMILCLTTLQPVVLALLLFYVPETHYWGKVIIGLLIVIYLMWLVYSLNNSPNFKSLEPGECGHLDYSFWKNIGSVPYFILAFFAILLIQPADIGLVVLITLLITLFLSSFLYTCKNETPSLWCLFSVITPIVLYCYLRYRGFQSGLEELSDFYKSGDY